MESEWGVQQLVREGPWVGGEARWAARRSQPWCALEEGVLQVGAAEAA